MKERFVIILNSVLTGIIIYFSSCNSKTSSDADSLLKDSLTIEKGKTSFVNKCASCHNFNPFGSGIGPHLAGITSEHSVDWIKNFIRDPKKIIDSGDTTAQKLFKQYKAVMPSFEYLSEEELTAIIAFIN